MARCAKELSTPVFGLVFTDQIKFPMKSPLSSGHDMRPVFVTAEAKQFGKFRIAFSCSR